MILINKVLTAGYFKLVHHCTFKRNVVVKLQRLTCIKRVVYACEHIFNGVGKPRKFSRKLELRSLSICETFPRFAIHGIQSLYRKTHSLEHLFGKNLIDDAFCGSDSKSYMTNNFETLLGMISLKAIRTMI